MTTFVPMTYPTAAVYFQAFPVSYEGKGGEFVVYSADDAVIKRPTWGELNSSVVMHQAAELYGKTSDPRDAVDSARTLVQKIKVVKDENLEFLKNN